MNNTIKTYITYDRYEMNEWFCLYQVTTSFTDVKKDYKNNLYAFLSSCPDDCHSYQIQVVNLDSDIYSRLLELSEEDDIDSIQDELIDIMTPIYENLNNNNCFLRSDGPEDFNEIISMYCDDNGLDYDDNFSDVEELLSDDEDLLTYYTIKYVDSIKLRQI